MKMRALSKHDGSGKTRLKPAGLMRRDRSKTAKIGANFAVMA
jgi:hypothetical protein